ncbi:MAG: dTDP-glucose 4,6-dehydratase [Oligoflexia bacterium]|nr:dTDP-glucose 4,6-dehydratase [Oligoflexia bacterium]
MEFKKLLVTGGAGFIGGHFVKLALKKHPNLEIINLDLLTYAGNLENLSELKEHKRHKFVKGNILDRSLVSELLAQGCDGVVNFAAESHVDRSITGPDAFIQTNIVGTQKLLEASRKASVKRFLQISTDEVYGTLGDTGEFSEETPLAPNSPYSASKASADLICRAYHHTYNMDVVVTRCSNNYGPNQFPEKLIPLMINNARAEKSLPVYGDGLNVRDWIYVEDHCQGVLDVLMKGKSGEVYNIGSDNEWPNIEIVKKLLNLLDKPQSLITFVKDRPGHDRRYAIDSSKIKRELGWKPSYDFETGLKKTVQWYLENDKWLSGVLDGSYMEYYQKQYSN